MLTYTLCSHLGWGVAMMKGPAVTLATVEWPFVEVKVAERRLNAAPLKWQEIFVWSGEVNKRQEESFKNTLPWKSKFIQLRTTNAGLRLRCNI